MFPVAGRMQSILQSILIQNGAKGGIRGLKALPSVTAPALAKPWHASAMLPSPQPNAVAEEICTKKTFHRLKSLFPSGPDRSIATATNQPEKTAQPLKSCFWSIVHSKSKPRHHLVGSELVNAPR